MNRLIRHMQRLALLCALSGLVACASVNKQHPEVMSGELTAEQKAQLAAVYFIRPVAIKTKGVANDAVRITYQEETLLEQQEGSYALLYLKPGKGLVKIYSKTLYTDQRMPVEVFRSREYKFIAGKTYFIYVRQLDEEFRGVFYEPSPVSLKEAKEIITPGGNRYGSTRASGIARSAPIDKITEVDEPPRSAVKSLAPALPEEIHKQEKYLLKQKPVPVPPEAPVPAK